jgi:hypothetical protein
MTLPESTRQLLLEWSLRVGILGLGWIGAQTVLPGWRVTQLEAEFHRHVAWADSLQRTMGFTIASDHEYILALVRLQCLKSSTDVVRAAGLPCAMVFSNRVPGS